MQDRLLGGFLHLAREEELIKDHVDLVEVEDEVELANVAKELIAGSGGDHAGESTRGVGRGAGGEGRYRSSTKRWMDSKYMSSLSVVSCGTTVPTSSSGARMAWASAGQGSPRKV